MIKDMFPILARYGSIFIYSYTVMLATGIILGIGLTAWMNRNNHSWAWFDAVLVILIGAILGGRLGFVFLRWDYFQEELSESWQITQGGLSYHPALLAGLCALFLWTIFKKQSFYKLSALLAPAFILVMAFGWGACWLEGCAYGQETVLGPLAADLPDNFGVFAIRYQSQLVGLVLSLLLFILIIWIGRRIKPGVIFWFTIGAVSLIHMLAGFLRGDPTTHIGNMRLDLFVDGLLVFISIILLQFEAKKTISRADHG
jgi:prolipoprotein diacylglyceryltransferase